MCVCRARGEWVSGGIVFFKFVSFFFTRLFCVYLSARVVVVVVGGGGGADFYVCSFFFRPAVLCVSSNGIFVLKNTQNIPIVSVFLYVLCA